MKIAIGADHGGYELKQHIIDVFTQRGYEFVDFGTNSPESVDYPDYAFRVGKSVTVGECGCGILICSTGIGMSIAANKVTGIRAAHCTDSYTAKMSRHHNNANVLAMGAKITGVAIAEEIVAAFLSEGFDGDRHERRVEKINNYKNS